MSDSNLDISNGKGQGHVLDLPDGGHIYVREVASGDEAFVIMVNKRPVLKFRALGREAALVLSALGTKFENNNVVSLYSVLSVEAVENSNADVWAGVYALWTKFHEQEYIPIIIENTTVTDYLLTSGLGRRAIDPAVTEIFLDRVTFWQGAGTGFIWHNPRGWLRHNLDYYTFPHSQTFTRSEKVIAQHPLRRPKPSPGTLLYSRFCTAVGRMLNVHVIDQHNVEDMAAFHRWMNDDRVNSGWGERGSEEQHQAYVAGVSSDPAVLPVIMNWDDERMGYAEIVWVKEDHVAPYIPTGALDFDRGLHVLVGENRFRGQTFSRAWYRSLTHYIFLSESRTTRVVAEPKRCNPAILRTSTDGGMHVESSFYFPYKHSVLTLNLRERLFKEDMFI